MPLPIQKVYDRMSGEGNFYMDYSTLIPIIPEKKKIVVASDQDAELLIKLWAASEKLADDVYQIKNSGISSGDVLRLKAHGFLTGGSEEVKFTGKAKAIITTMVLGEGNKFQKQQKKKSYTEIVASMNLKGKKGYRMPTYAANSNLIRVVKNENKNK